MSAPPLPVEDILQALDLSRAEPGLGLLQALFSRFNARVPFETASKIERDAAVSDPESKPRRPELFWREHLERGTGGTCFARVAAFEALLRALGYRTRKILGRVSNDFDHAALIVEGSGRSWLCDVGFPLPALLPSEAGELDTPLGCVRISPMARGLHVDLGGIPEGPRRVELFLEAVPEEEFDRLWRETFRTGSKFLSAVSLRRQLENRVISFARGQVRVDDLHSRLTVPLPDERARRLSELFEVEAELLARAFARVGDPEPESREATLTAYLEVACDPSAAFAAIATPSGYRRLLEGVGRVLPEEATSDGFLLRLEPPEAGPGEAGMLEDRVVPDLPARRLEVVRSSGRARSETFLQAQERDGKSYLLRGVRLSGPREDLLRNDSLRGRLAGSLAVDLLAWARLL
ncbi:MAG: arylamine N-acetyltransferase [Thermoanaerobaculia bacterium]